MDIGERSIYRLQQRQWEGRPIEPAKTGPKGSMKLTVEDERLLCEAVAHRPGVTAKQVIPLLSVEVAESTGVSGVEASGPVV